MDEYFTMAQRDQLKDEAEQERQKKEAEEAVIRARKLMGLSERDPMDRTHVWFD